MIPEVLPKRKYYPLKTKDGKIRYVRDRITFHETFEKKKK